MTGPLSRCGYSLVGANQPHRNPTKVHMRISAGDTVIAPYLINNVTITTQPLEQSNASIITPSVLKPAMLAVIAAWDVTCAPSTPATSTLFTSRLRRPGLSWIWPG